MMGQDQNYPTIKIERGIEDEEWTAMAFCEYSSNVPRPLHDRTFMLVAHDPSMLVAVEKLIDQLLEGEDVCIAYKDSLQESLKTCVPYHKRKILGNDNEIS